MGLVEPLLPTWHRGWHYAFDKYLSYPIGLAADHDDTTAAQCIRRHMMAWLQNNMRGMKGVDMIRAGATRQLQLLDYLGAADARFKKMDGSGWHANYPTDQQDDFDRQRPLPFVPPAAVRLTC